MSNNTNMNRANLFGAEPSVTEDTDLAICLKRKRGSISVFILPDSSSKNRDFDLMHARESSNILATRSTLPEKKKRVFEIIETIHSGSDKLQSPSSKSLFCGPDGEEFESLSTMFKRYKNNCS